MKTIACFDLDGTLLRKNCSFAFCRYLVQKRVVSRRSFFYCIRKFLSYRLAKGSLLSLHTSVFASLFEGKEYGLIKSNIENFLDEHLQKLIHKPAIATMQEWQRRGADLFILSSSPSMLVKRIGEKMGVKNIFATEYQVNKEGKLSHLEHLLDGKAKGDFLRRLKREGAAEKIVAYSDHTEDLPFLEAATEPFVVNPNPKLRQIARMRRWGML